jgi:hypothetical protein
MKTYGTTILCMAFLGPMCFCAFEGNPGGIVLGTICGYLVNMCLSCVTLSVIFSINKEIRE